MASMAFCPDGRRGQRSLTRSRRPWTTNTDVIVPAGEDEDFDAFQDGSRPARNRRSTSFSTAPIP